MVANGFRGSLLKGSATRLERSTIDAAQLYCPPPSKLQRRHGRAHRAAGGIVAINVEIEWH